MFRIVIILLFVFVLQQLSIAQTLATLEADLSRPAHGLQVPAHINLDELTFIADSALSLVEVTGGQKISVPFQITSGEHRIFHWLISDSGQPKRTYQLISSAPQKFPEIIAEKKDGSVTISSGDKNLLRYHYGTVYPPAGIDSVFKRSGFIHPLWTPHGQELTRIQAPDHYHHYGIWNPWTHVLFEKDTVDFWNLKGKKGTVRFAHFTEIMDGPVYAEFEALHEHVVFKKEGGEKIALHELQTIRVYKSAPNSNYFIVDFTSQLNCASESPVLLLAYRYAGLGWRTTEFWNNDNCEVLTSEGKTRENTDGSKAKWCIVQGALPGNDYGGVAFLSYPANYNFPEPMRIWTKNTNGRGDMFFNFAPTKDKDWLLVPGKIYVLKYRWVVFNEKLDAPQAESAWQYFAMPPKIKWSKP
jgi:Methane oxygenase PmoA